jgi:hypothetical protein
LTFTLWQGLHGQSRSSRFSRRMTIPLYNVYPEEGRVGKWSGGWSGEVEWGVEWGGVSDVSE